MNENDVEDRVLRYLRNEMTTEEQTDFEEACKQDSELQEAYKFQKRIQDGLAMKFMREKKAILEAIEEENGDNSTGADQQPDNKSKSKWLYIGSIAFTAAAATGLILFLLMPGQNPQALADKHFQPFPDYVTDRYRGPSDNAGQKSVPNVFKKGMVAYRSSSYKKAATFLKQAIDQNKQQALGQFYLGNALMASNKPDKAIQHLKGLKGKLNSDYQIKQQWYLALAYIKSGRFSKAQPILDKLTKREKFQHQKAARELKNAIE